MRQIFWSFGLVLLLVAMPILAEAQTTTPPATSAPTTPPPETAPAATPEPAAAATPKNVHFTYKKGGFAQGGATVNQELEFFKTPGFGITAALGYQINPQIGLYVRSDFFGVVKDDVTHLDFSVIPSARFTVFDNLYGFAGIGYNLIHARAGSTITGSESLISRNFHSFTIEGGAGYTYFFKENFGLWTEAGLNYLHLEKVDLTSRDLWRPFLRVGAVWQF